MQEETFKDIKGYEGLYQISNLGNVKSLSRKYAINSRILSPGINKNGYYIVVLSNKDQIKETFYIHHLVIKSFSKKINSHLTLIIDHIDNNKANNSINNLQWITQRENTSKDRFRHNHESKYVGVFLHKPSKKWYSRIAIDNEKIHLGFFEKEIDAHKAYQKALSNLM